QPYGKTLEIIILSALKISIDPRARLRSDCRRRRPPPLQARKRRLSARSAEDGRGRVRTRPSQGREKRRAANCEQQSGSEAHGKSPQEVGDGRLELALFVIVVAVDLPAPGAHAFAVVPNPSMDRCVTRRHVAEGTTMDGNRSASLRRFDGRDVT